MARSKTPMITVSFKEDELWMYEILKSHSSSTAYLKDVLKEYFTNLGNSPNIQKNSTNSNAIEAEVDVTNDDLFKLI